TTNGASATPWSGSAEMKISLYAVGRVKGVLADAVHEYESRAARYWKLELVEVEAGAAGSADPAAVREAEEERLLRRMPDQGQELVALTRSGQPMGSRAFASYLQTHALNGRDVGFVIGGAYGLGPRLLERAR